MYKPSSKKRINRLDNFDHWPESIKRTIECFPFLDIMEYTEKDTISDIYLTTSLLKMFSMFSVKTTVQDDTVNAVSLMCINCKRETYIQPKSGKEFYDKMITPFVMNSMLHHVGMPWMISSKKEMDYDNFSNHQNVGWLETGPWQNKNICSKLYGTTF